MATPPAKDDRQREAQLVAEFLATKGVTRCPTAVAAPGQAVPTAEACQAHQARGLDPLGASWKSQQAKFVRGRQAEAKRRQAISLGQRHRQTRQTATS